MSNLHHSKVDFNRTLTNLGLNSAKKRFQANNLYSKAKELSLTVVHHFTNHVRVLYQVKFPSFCDIDRASIPSLFFYLWKIEDHRSQVSCLRLHNEQGNKPGAWLNLNSVDLETTYHFLENNSSHLFIYLF